MSTNTRPTSAAANGSREQGQPMTYFEEQREMLLNEISQSMEHVLQNINKLNRSLEGVIAVGNEFSSVEALWSQFENVMAKDSNPEEQQAGGGAASWPKHEGKDEDQTEVSVDEGDEY